MVKFNLINNRTYHIVYRILFIFHWIKYYAEDSPISIGNGDYGTQVFTDQSIAEIIEFNQRYISFNFIFDANYVSVNVDFIHNYSFSFSCYGQSMPDPCRSIITIRIGNIDNPILVGNDHENLGLDGEIRTLQQLNQLSEVLILNFKFNLFGTLCPLNLIF
jgi:hypothetical protein